MSTVHTPDRLLTTGDVADLLRISRWTVRRLVERGDLRGVRVGDRRRFRRKDIDAYLERDREASP